MKGIGYLIDESGQRKAVVIDLVEHRALWADFHDALLTEHRRDDPQESVEEVNEQLTAPID